MVITPRPSISGYSTARTRGGISVVMLALRVCRSWPRFSGSVRSSAGAGVEHVAVQVVGGESGWGASIGWRRRGGAAAVRAAWRAAVRAGPRRLVRPEPEPVSAGVGRVGGAFGAHGAGVRAGLDAVRQVPARAVRWKVAVAGGSGGSARVQGGAAAHAGLRGFGCHLEPVPGRVGQVGAVGAARAAAGGAAVSDGGTNGAGSAGSGPGDRQRGAGGRRRLRAGAVSALCGLSAVA